MSRDDFQKIPLELRQIPRWIVWKDEGGKGKIPHSAVTGRKVNITKKTAGCEFQLAEERLLRGGYSGLGFILNGDGIVAIDLDDCVSNGVIDAGAYGVLQTLGFGYVEYSPSGRGVHMWGRSETVSPGRRGKVNGVSVELYSDLRYITVTGDAVLTMEGDGLSVLPGYDTVLGLLRRSSALKNCKKQLATPRVESNPAVSIFTQEIQEDQEQQVLQDIQEFQDIKVTQDSQAIGLTPEAEFDFPSSCHVRGVGQRHHLVFQLARWLKSRFQEPNEELLRTWVKAWHTRFLANIRTKNFDYTWAEFVNAWRSVRHPMGEVLDLAIGNPCPLEPWMEDHGLGPIVDQLLGLCLRLAHNNEDGVFFLASRPLAERLGYSHQTINTNLNLLVSYGYLMRTYKGHTGRASEYRIGLARVDPFVT